MRTDGFCQSRVRRFWAGSHDHTATEICTAFLDSIRRCREMQIRIDRYRG